jgi:hypothetical protein
VIARHEFEKFAAPGGFGACVLLEIGGEQGGEAAQFAAVVALGALGGGLNDLRADHERDAEILLRVDTFLEFVQPGAVAVDPGLDRVDVGADFVGNESRPEPIVDDGLEGCFAPLAL